MSNKTSNNTEETPLAAGDAQTALNTAHKRRSRRKIVIIGVLAAIVVVIVGVGVAAASYLSSINTQLTQGDKTDEEIQEIERTLKTNSSVTEPFYMLLIGSDARSDDPSMGARSDTNVVMRVDPVNDVVTLISIPRDTRITIDGYGTCKFNAAYAYNGVAGAITAANELLGIEISEYAEVNFDGLMELVDAVGGVDIDVDQTINDTDADLDYTQNHIVIEAGEQHLNGEEALVYARSRAFADGDFTRTEHQRTLITAIAKKVISLPITEIPGVVQSAVNCVTTSLSLTEIISLAQQFNDDNDLTIYSAMLPSTTATISGVSYVINDSDATAEMMALVEAGKDPSTVVSTMTSSDAISAASKASANESQDSSYIDDDDKSFYTYT
ncbi:MAG: LCP family protein, partial [Eggerthellaceae bacterium]|nr:LCP family protein [Eggerthellaceae bacterium]